MCTKCDINSSDNVKDKSKWRFFLLVTKTDEYPCFLWHFSRAPCHFHTKKNFWNWITYPAVPRHWKYEKYIVHSTLTFTWMPLKVFHANSMLLSLQWSLRIFPIKLKFDTLVAFLYSKNFETRLISSSKTYYHCVDILLHCSKSTRHGIHFLVGKNWTGFENFHYLQKAAIVLNFCLIWKIESAQKTFKDIQVRVSVECIVTHILLCPSKMKPHKRKKIGFWDIYSAVENENEIFQDVTTFNSSRCEIFGLF